VSFKLTWWTDEAVPLWLKAAWGAAIAALVMLVVVPPLLVRAPVVRLMRRGDAPTWLFLAAIGLLGFGYVMDDILGRGRIGVSPEVTVAIEEISETLGAAAFLASLVLTLRRPLSSRVGG
jgi:hypothetical protein